MCDGISVVAVVRAGEMRPVGWHAWALAPIMANMHQKADHTPVSVGRVVAELSIHAL